MYVCMYVRMYVRMIIRTYVHAFMHACMHLHACFYVCSFGFQKKKHACHTWLRGAHAGDTTSMPGSMRTRDLACGVRGLDCRGPPGTAAAAWRQVLQGLMPSLARMANR
jgi:hypothetical protein